VVGTRHNSHRRWSSEGQLGQADAPFPQATDERATFHSFQAGPSEKLLNNPRGWEGTKAGGRFPIASRLQATLRQPSPIQPTLLRAAAQSTHANPRGPASSHAFLRTSKQAASSSRVGAKAMNLARVPPSPSRSCRAA
jgi:hypothetical protein